MNIKFKIKKNGTNLPLVLIGVIFLAIPAVKADNVTVDGRFKEGNIALEAGDLQKAETTYLELVGQGFNGAALYYNLGNLYYKKGERGKAVLWYERAKLLSPRDSDIDFNLSLAESHMKNEKAPWFEQFALFFSNKELGIVMGLFLWLFFGLLGCRSMGWIKEERILTPALFFTGFLSFISLGWFASNSYVMNQPQAIILVPPGEIRNGPGTDYPVGFTVPEGSHVLVLDRRPDWIQVGVPQQGLKGWISAKEIDFISPYSLN